MKKIIEYELPAYWASALINNDWSGIEGSLTVLECRAWLRANPRANIVRCSDNSYTGRYDGLICDMLTYDVEVTE